MSRSFCGIRQERIKMPTTYAHDLFGQKVYRQMPEEVKKVIRENGELYRIGLHGPDIFFYYFIFKIIYTIYILHIFINIYNIIK